METAETTNAPKKIGIVGAGPGGKEILSLFLDNSQATVVYIVDTNPDAPGMVLAKRQGIKTLSRLESALKTETVDFVIDATGSREVGEQILESRGNAEVVSGATALLMYRVMEESRRDLTKQVFSDLSGIRQEIDSSTRDVSKTLHGINKISNELEVLAINAGIQASRAAQFGKGFAVVAGEVKATARVARGLAGDIERVINEISSMSGKIEQSLKKIM